jgi:Phosphatidylinositol N-acetylglucosaminyltransferase subunit Y
MGAAKRKKRKIAANARTNGPLATDAAALQQWRRVASTHHLEDLIGSADPTPPSHTARLVAGVCLVVVTIFAASVASLALWRCGSGFASAEVADSSLLYYAQAAAAFVPVTVVFVFVNWFSNKLFKHNT